MVVVKQNKSQDYEVTPIQQQHIPVNKVQYEAILHLESKPIDSSPNEKVVALRRPLTICRPVILDYYIVYFTGSNFDIRLPEDLNTFSQAMNGYKFTLWLYVMNNKLEYIYKDQIWDLIKLLGGATIIGYKWIYKIK